MNINQELAVMGLYKLRRIRKEDIEDENPVPVDETDWQENLITDRGLHNMCNTQFMYYCVVGEGGRFPHVDDLTLERPLMTVGVHSHQGTGLGSVDGDEYMYTRWKYRYPAVSAPMSIREIGVTYSSGGGNLTSRSLVTNTLGEPSTFFLMPGEILEAFYEIRVILPKTDKTGLVQIGNTEYAYTSRLCNYIGSHNLGSSANGTWNGAGLYLTRARTSWPIEAYSGDIGSITGNPSGTGGRTYTQSASKISDEPSVLYTCHSNIDYNNYGGGIGAIKIMYGPVYWQVGFSPKIPKTNEMSFGCTFKVGYKRYEYEGSAGEDPGSSTEQGTAPPHYIDYSTPQISWLGGISVNVESDKMPFNLANMGEISMPIDTNNLRVQGGIDGSFIIPQAGNQSWAFYEWTLSPPQILAGAPKSLYEPNEGIYFKWRIDVSGYASDPSRYARAFAPMYLAESTRVMTRSWEETRDIYFFDNEAPNIKPGGLGFKLVNYNNSTGVYTLDIGGKKQIPYDPNDIWVMVRKVAEYGNIFMLYGTQVPEGIEYQFDVNGNEWTEKFHNWLLNYPYEGITIGNANGGYYTRMAQVPVVEFLNNLAAEDIIERTIGGQSTPITPLYIKDGRIRRRT